MSTLAAIEVSAKDTRQKASAKIRELEGNANYSDMVMLLEGRSEMLSATLQDDPAALHRQVKTVSDANAGSFSEKGVPMHLQP
eukprot:6068418-Alexandrium_andersonii.AAC.1